MRIRPPFLALALLAFTLRALIPIGFMPAADGTFSLMICPGGFPPQLLPQAKAASDGMGMPIPMPSRHGHGLMEDGFCAFTTGFSAAPPPLIPAMLYLLLAVIAIVLTSTAAPALIRLVHTPQARAPPIPA
ncbi:MAG TPA: DUF2946 family protein [Steroidobacteraceae bacterium]|nr:DUF2946 family protein [Steroidobacteraceae bacterium]